jgi:phosphoenolpyruvate carboxykinase (ATP)
MFIAGGTAMNAMPEPSLHTPLIQLQLASLGLRWMRSLSWNDNEAVLYQAAVSGGEVQVAEGGALVTHTGTHTGRSPKDKFIVLDETTSHNVWWENNQPMSRAHFETLKADLLIHARMKNLFVQDLEACADPAHSLPTRVITEHAWHALFMRHLLKPVSTDAAFAAELTIINLPSFKADPARHGTNSSTVIAFDLKNNLVLIGGTLYAGEIKKAVFTVLNYMLPAAHVLPMHCSANVGDEGDTTIFFGLSGTGKTTLSADPTRTLIGDDEHGWGDAGVFNIENGCYAKVINLSEKAEPDIFKAAHQFGAVLENVVMDKVSRKLDLSDSSLTENTRAAYPLSAIANASGTRMGPAPKTIIMLTADAFGVLPPIAKLNPEEAMQQFLSGYTAKLAGTERGVKAPEATFSACFGAPFLPRHPQVYADLLKELMAKHNTRCFLLNTGWTGGAYGVGKRMALSTTRTLLQAAISGALDNVETRRDENFGFAVPLHIEGVDDTVLNPRQSWSDGSAYDAAAKNLVALFAKAKARSSKSEILTRQAAE